MDSTETPCAIVLLAATPTKSEIILPFTGTSRACRSFTLSGQALIVVYTAGAPQELQVVASAPVQRSCESAWQSCPADLEGPFAMALRLTRLDLLQVEYSRPKCSVGLPLRIAVKDQHVRLYGAGLAEYPWVIVLSIIARLTGVHNFKRIHFARTCGRRKQDCCVCYANRSECNCANMY